MRFVVSGRFIVWNEVCIMFSRKDILSFDHREFNSIDKVQQNGSKRLKTQGGRCKRKLSHFWSSQALCLGESALLCSKNYEGGGGGGHHQTEGPRGAKVARISFASISLSIYPFWTVHE